ncbi:MAG TPA: DinB family protein [Thermomicrobiales bacterium]|nr:DinB family protein [Thermomicrobiales bacterium]
MAERFHRARQEFIRVIDSCDASQLQAHCHGEQCTVAALASHVAGFHALGAQWVQQAVRGEELPTITMNDIDAMNAEQTVRDANRSPQDILQELREHGGAAEQVVRSVSDDDLDRTVQFPLLGGAVSIQRLIEIVVIGDVEGHLKSIKAAIATG